MVCSRSSLDRENQAGKTWSWPRLQLALRLAFSQAPLCPKNKGVERRWLLLQSWASCYQVISSLGVPWLSVGSGRRL